MSHSAEQTGDAEMETCERLQQASAYHDGELPAAERLSFETHLAACAQCRSELAQLAAMSRLLTFAHVAGMPDETLARLHGNAIAAPERNVVRLAERLIAAAAVITVACGGLLWRGTNGSEMASSGDTAWQTAAVTLNVETVSSDAQQLAQWMIEGLTTENTNE